MRASAITHFTQLDIWKHAHALVRTLYNATKDFPAEERFGLMNQMRRLAVSVPSNIAEGFARCSIKEKRAFYYTATASLAELYSQALVARNLRYVSDTTYAALEERITTVDKLIAGLVKSTTYRANG